MREGTERIAPALPKAYELHRRADRGRGRRRQRHAARGGLAAAPGLKGILFDTAEGVAGADEEFRRAGLSDRCVIETGDFFEAVPGGDVMLVKGVLHDWNDRRCVVLLRACRRSIAADGRLLVLEPVMPSGLGTPEAAGAVMSDIAMLVYTGGRTEFRDLLAAAGFDLTEVTPPLGGSAIRILVARPA